MSRLQFLGRLTVAVLFVVAASSAQAQDASTQTSRSAKQRKSASKPQKVWTDDNIGTVRTASDRHQELEQRQADGGAASIENAADRQQASAGSEKPASGKAVASSRPDALSNPKTVDDADRMLAWEHRDLHDQSEFVDGLQERINQTSDPDEKARLQVTLEERKQVLATIRKEIGELEAEKKALQNKGSASASSAQP